MQRRFVAEMTETALANARDGGARVVLTFEVQEGHAEVVFSLLMPQAPEDAPESLADEP